MNFPYVPRGVHIVSTGPANGADDNSAYVRALLAIRQPELSEALEAIVEEDDESC